MGMVRVMGDFNWAEEDARLRDFVRRCYPGAEITEIAVKRYDAGFYDFITLTIRTPEPSVIVGKGGQKIHTVLRALQTKSGHNIRIRVSKAPPFANS